MTWLDFPQGQGGRHFLNTFVSDIQGDVLVPMVQGLDFGADLAWKRNATLNITPSCLPTLNCATIASDTQSVDGLLFDYCTFDRFVALLALAGLRRAKD